MIEENKSEIKEILIFFLKLSILSGILYIISQNVNFYYFQRFTAERVYDFLGLIDISAEIEGVRLVVEEINFLITEDCTAWKGIFFFFALLISSKKKLKEVGKGLLVGIPALYSLNLLRILLLISSNIWFGSAAYGILHDLLWNLTMILAVIALWRMWTKRTNFLTEENN